jgi:hypothetical protein
VKVLELVVGGPAQQQGSVKTYVPTYKGGEPVRRGGPRGPIVVNVTTDNRELKRWRDEVAKAAKAALAGVPAPDGRVWPLEGVGFTVSEVAYFRRPQGHYGTGRNAELVKDAAPARPITGAGGHADMAPDVDKLLRAALDALTGVVWKDDSQVTDVIGRKRYAVPDEHGDGVMAVLQVWINDVQAAADLPSDERRRYVDGLTAGPVLF